MKTEYTASAELGALSAGIKVSHTDLTENFDAEFGDPEFCAGTGQYHTNEFDSVRPEKKLTPYNTVTFARIREMCDSPPKVNKEKGKWFIPSTLKSRDFDKQRLDGRYGALACDFDAAPKTLTVIATDVSEAIMGANFEAYNSRSAKPELPKARVLVEVAELLDFETWRICQNILYKKLEDKGHTLDTALLRPAQLVYLPNRGELYETVNERKANVFNPLIAWATEIEASRAVLATAKLKKEEVNHQREVRSTEIRAQVAAGMQLDGDDILRSFNATTEIGIILKRNGYEENPGKPGSWRHPNSQTGNFSLDELPDGRVFGLSSEDPLGSAKNDGHSVSPFDALMILEHNSDFRTALRAIKREDAAREFAGAEPADGHIAPEQPVETDDEPKAEPDLSAEQVLAELRGMDAETALASWIQMSIHLCESDGEHVVGEVARMYNRGARPLKRDLKMAKMAAERETHNTNFNTDNNNKVMIPVRDDATTFMAEKAEAALLEKEKPGRYVLFGGALSMVTVEPVQFTHAIDDEAAAPPPIVSIRMLDDPGLIAKIERRVCFFKTDTKGLRVAAPVPQRVLQHLRSNMSESPVRHLVPHIAGVLAHPVVLANGNIVSSKGYNPDSGFFIWRGADVECRPYEQFEAAVALDRLRNGEFLRGFEFESELDRDLAIAGLLTAVQRRVMDTAPGLLINASMQSSGKTTLARRIHVILTGRDMPVTTVPQSEEEMAKRVTTFLMSNPEMVCFDNFGDGLSFRSEVVAAMITSPQYFTRLLGSMTEVVLPSNTLPVLTGNNIKLGNDEITRWIDCHLSPSTDRPESRVFDRPDVIAHGRSIRLDVLRDVIGIVAGYLQSGGPVIINSNQGTRFQLWGRIVRESLIWAGGLDVAEAFNRNSEASEQKQAVAALFNLLHRKFGDKPFIASDVVALCRSRSISADFSDEVVHTEGINGALVVEALESLLCKNPEQMRSVAHTLRANLGKRVHIEGVGMRKMRDGRSMNARSFVLVP